MPLKLPFQKAENYTSAVVILAQSCKVQYVVLICRGGGGFGILQGTACVYQKWVECLRAAR